MRLCKDSAGILLRFSVELSKYEAEIHHVPSVKTKEVLNMLTEQHKDVKNIMHENKIPNALSEADSEHFLQRLLLPEGMTFSPQEVATLLGLESPFLPHNKTKKLLKAKTRVRNTKMNSRIFGERKIKVFPTTFIARVQSYLNKLENVTLIA